MSVIANPIVATYSRLAHEYDEDANFRSCWGRAAEQVVGSIMLRETYKRVLEVGCGPGRAIRALASTAPDHIQFTGIDPAENMCRIAAERLRECPGVHIQVGSFESMPVETSSVDYLYSIHAFHWVTDLSLAMAEIVRVLAPNGEMDLFFVGRDNGREFIRKTSSIFLKYMGPALLLESTRLRKRLTREAALHLFAESFDPSCLSVEESYTTYYDTLEGHLSWWVRAEGHFLKLPREKKSSCDREVRAALQTLDGGHGIPYTIHQLHVRLRRVCVSR